MRVEHLYIGTELVRVGNHARPNEEAIDEALNELTAWEYGEMSICGAVHEGLGFLSDPYLPHLLQRDRGHPHETVIGRLLQ